MRLSIVNGTAFVDFSEVDALTPYIGRKIKIYDSAGKKLLALLRKQERGETLGIRITANIDLIIL